VGRGRRRRAVAGIALAAATSTAAVVAPLARGGALALPAAGYCVPAPDDAAYVARAAGAAALGPLATRPVAILDTGVDPGVPSLAGRVLPGIDALSGTAVGGDWDGHGTEAAGLAAGSGAGVLGVSPRSTILPVRTYPPGARTASVDAVVGGLAQAVAHGAGVVVIEGSAPAAGFSDDDVRRLTTAVDRAFLAGVLVVAGAGDDTLADPAIPASLPHVLVAGAATYAPSRSAQVDTGPWLDLLVPAEGVEGPLPGALCAAGFGFSTGTSFAAPSLGAAVALARAARPALSPQQLFDVVRRAGTDLGAPGRDDDSGYGALDVAAALAATPAAQETSPEVDDDPFWVRGAFAKAHPPLLTRTKLRFKAAGTVSPAKDPADVFRVSLSRRERMVVSVTAADPDALLELSLLDPRVEAFDVTDDVDEWRLAATGGLSIDPQLELTAKRSGSYYIAVEAAPAVDPDDPAATTADVVPYTLSAYKQRPKAKARARKKR
jgi:Subtilase family